MTYDLNELQALRRFLDGSDHLDGAFFGQRHPERRGAFWWRTELKHIDALIADHQALQARVAELEADNKRLEGLVIGWLDYVTGPDEQGAYIHHRQLVEESMPIKARVCVRNAMEQKP